MAGRAADPDGFGGLVRRSRTAAGLTLEDLAELTGLGVRTISDIERGLVRRPHRSSVELICAALGLGDRHAANIRRGADLVIPVAAAGRPDAASTPRQLPAAVSHFTGRSAELHSLARQLKSAGAAGTMAIAALAGTAGVGKTALAVHWAHLVADSFPDGQLYVNLRGYGPERPLAAPDALAGFLRSLGVSARQIPDEADERARLYRSRLARRRVLVLLDNASDGAQVRPLLPGDPGCMTVVTSRDSLAGLVAADGAIRLELDLLPEPDAVTLLRSLIGARADAGAEALIELAGLCAGLPLALRIAAEQAAARPDVPLAELATELATGRLDMLDAGEEQADVRAVLSWSVRQLPADASSAFALIGLHPGADVDRYACAALAGISPRQVQRLLGRLHRASLLQATAPGRYGLHDLLRDYARERAAACDTGGQQQEAMTRLLDYYLAAAATASDVMFPARAHGQSQVSVAAEIPDLPGQAQARAWLDTELANLVAVVVHSSGHGWPRHATRLAGILFHYLINGSHLAEAATIYRHALQAARRAGDLAAEADALNGLGGIAIMKGRFRDAADHYQTALECYRRCGDRAGQARVLNNLGITADRLHDQSAAAGYYRQAITAHEDAGDFLGVARVLSDLAGVEADVGSLDQAAEHLQQALHVFRDQHDELREAEALSRMGELSLRRGQAAQAASLFQQALTIFRSIDYRNGAAVALRNLGDLSLSQRDYQQARSYLQQALDQFRGAGDQFGQIMTLRGLARALHGTGQADAARSELNTALQLAADTGNLHEQASTHRELAESHHRAEQRDHARRHWQQALAIYTQLQAPEASQVEDRIESVRGSNEAASRPAGS